MIGRVAKQAVQSGAGFQMPVEWALMAVLGVLIIVVVLVGYRAPSAEAVYLYMNR